MEKKATIFALGLALGIGGIVATSQPTTARASKTYTRAILKNPTGYYYTNKGQYAFHWMSKKHGNKTYHYLLMSDFKAGVVYTGGATRYQVTANRRTFTTTFRLYTNSGKLKAGTYKFGMYKLSNSKYRAKLYNYKGGKLLSNKGTTYSIARTSKNPFSRMFNAYSKKPVTKQITNALQTRYDDGYSSVDPKSADGQKAISVGVKAGYNFVKDAFVLKN